MPGISEAKRKKGRPTKAFKQAQAVADKKEALRLMRSKEKRAEIIKISNDFISNVKASRSALETKWADWYDSYLQQKVSSKRENISQLDLGMLHQQVEILTGIFDTMLFSTTPSFDIVPPEPSDAKVCEVRKTILGWQMEVMNFRRKVKEGIRRMLIFGTQFYKVIWRTGPERNITTPAGSKDEQDERLDFLAPNLRDIYIDPYVTRDEFVNADIIIHRSQTDEGHLRRMVEEKTFDKTMVNKAIEEGKDKAEQKAAEYDPEQKYNSDSPEQRSTTYYQFGDRPTSHIRKFQLDEMWFNYDKDDSGTAVPCIAVVVDSKTLVRIDDNPLWTKAHPFLVSTFLPLEGFIYGRGVPAVNQDLNLAGRDFLNQMMDDINLMINMPMIATRGSGIKPDNMKIYPNKLFISNTTVGDLQPVVVPNIIPDVMAAMSSITDIAKINSGATDTLQGMAFGGRTSATEASRAYDAAFSRMLSHARDVENDVFKPFLHKGWKLNEQMMTNDMFLRIVGKQGLEYKGQFPKALVGDFDAMPVGVNQMENRSTKLQNFMGYINIVGSLPPHMTRVKLWKLLKKGYELFGFKDYDDTHEPIPERQGIDVQDENGLLAQNYPLDTTFFDDHEEHIRGHEGSPEAMKTENGQIHRQLHYQQMGQQASQGNAGVGATSTAPQSMPQGGMGDLLGSAPQGAGTMMTAPGAGDFAPQG